MRDRSIRSVISIDAPRPTARMCLERLFLSSARVTRVMATCGHGLEARSRCSGVSGARTRDGTVPAPSRGAPHAGLVTAASARARAPSLPRRSETPCRRGRLAVGSALRRPAIPCRRIARAGAGPAQRARHRHGRRPRSCSTVGHGTVVGTGAARSALGLRHDAERSSAGASARSRRGRLATRRGARALGFRAHTRADDRVDAAALRRRRAGLVQHTGRAPNGALRPSTEGDPCRGGASSRDDRGARRRERTASQRARPPR